jgi:hypothetical protein
MSHHIAEIQDSTEIGDWQHIATQDNPADVISRGLMPSKLEHTTLWWKGPTFLHKREEVWPSNKFAQTAELLEMKSLTVIHEQLNESFPVIMKCSCFPKLQ